MKTPLPLPFLVWSLFAVVCGSSVGFGELDEAAVSSEETFPKPSGVTASNRYFQVFAEEALSAQYVAMAGELFAREFSTILPPPSRSQPVLVSLVPEDGEEAMATDFLTRIRPGGQVQLFISWGEATTRQTLERALVQAHLTYLSGAYSDHPVHVPLWLELAGQHFARSEAITGHAHHLARELEKSGPMQIEEILGAQRGEVDDDKLGAQAYWLFRFLEEKSERRGQFRNFLIRLLRNEDPRVALSATYGNQVRSMAEVQLWWWVGVAELIGSPDSPVPMAEESGRRVRELSTLLFTTEQGDVRLGPEDFWAYRNSDTLMRALQHRQTMVRLALNAMHPYYHNAVLSLDQVLQTVVVGNEDAYRQALVTYRHDLRVADELTEDTGSILDDLSAELADS